MWVKICANTNVEDTLEALRLGADAVGFVFAPSARQVTAAQVRAIVQELPEGIERVGVFGNLPAEEIARAAETAQLSAVQLHGGYDPLLTKALGGLGVALIQTTHWTVGEDAASAQRVAQALTQIAQSSPSQRVLIDAKVGKASGGTGVSFDWAAAQIALAKTPSLRIIVAGGLRPETVAQAIRTLRPWGVDVASGVEASPGKKDWEKLRLFIENARQALGSTGHFAQ